MKGILIFKIQSHIIIRQKYLILTLKPKERKKTSRAWENFYVFEHVLENDRGFDMRDKSV